MKKICVLSLFLILIQLTLAQGENKRVLFIGNSYTDVNNLPQLIQLAAESTGDCIDYRSNTPGGCTFQEHCSNQSMELIRQGGWDIVVLQEQSQLPSFPLSQVQNECFPYAQQLVDSIYAINPDGEAMFYMTWGRENGDPINANVFPPLATYEGMDSLLYERYMYMARTFDASVCPVGRVWRYLRANTDIRLYSGDGSHPSLQGSYAAACAFYSLIFRRSPLSITYNPGIEEREAQTIRNAVQTVVFDTLSFWLRQTPDTTLPDTTVIDTTTQDSTSIDTTTTDTTLCINFEFPERNVHISVYPNPANNEATIVVDGSATGFDAVLYDLRGRRLRSCKLNQRTTVLPLDGLAPGIYILSILSRHDTRTIRLIKQ